ncbi:MAG: lipase/acyltransferase domain-containing protein [Actinomycetota bacterium]
MDDVVVLLPGITGSVLRKDGKDVWAMSPGAVLRAVLSLGESITDLELKDDGALDDGVTAPRLMPDLHLIPGLWKIDGYGKVGRYIREAFDVEPERNYFEFPYDWRRDNRRAAAQLKERSDVWLHDRRVDHPDAKLVLVAHSMGGLVARYFLECLDGWRDSRMLVTFGTPFRGSLNALGFITQGMRKGFGPLTLVDLSNLLRSFTSVYQLLPIYPCLRNEGAEGLVRLTEAGSSIPNLDPTRVAAADVFHREIERAVEAHADDDEYRSNRYAIHPIVGTFQPTGQSAARTGSEVEILRSYRGQDRGGDSTVPRDSATPIELPHEEGAMFASERHASLQNLDGALVHLAGVLSGRDTGAFRGLPATRLGLDLDDLYGADQRIPVRVRSEDEAAVLTAWVQDERGVEVARSELPRGIDEWRHMELGPLPAGTYRIGVAGGPLVQPVADRFVVYGPELT